MPCTVCVIGGDIETWKVKLFREPVVGQQSNRSNLFHPFPYLTSYSVFRFPHHIPDHIHKISQDFTRFHKISRLRIAHLLWHLVEGWVGSQRSSTGQSGGAHQHGIHTGRTVTALGDGSHHQGGTTAAVATRIEVTPRRAFSLVLSICSLCWECHELVEQQMMLDDLWWSLMIFDDLWWSLMQSWQLHPRNLCDRAHIAICLRQEHCKSHALKLECWSRDSWFWGSITLEASYCDWTCSNGLCAFDNSWVGKL